MDQQHQSKNELVYQRVNYGNIEGIKALRREGAGLEWIDREGKTPLILACMNPELENVAKNLIEFRANLNAYHPGPHAGTPLHHAARRGLQNTVKLLLSHGANPQVVNDDCQTPLDVARAQGFGNVVHAIEDHICLFSGWMREFYGPGFLEVLAPQLLSRKVWVVILPTSSCNMSKPFKLDLAIYLGRQDAQPRTVIALWKANLEELTPNQPDPSVIILDNSTKRRIKLAPAEENDLQQFQRFCDACKGLTQMGQLHQSNDELVYQQVNCGNIEGIKALWREGAGLEWINREGKTPLILACMNPTLENVAKILIELGANLNAYRPGRHAGTPLHHAAKRGLQNTVKLLLSHGANPLVVNDDCQTPLDVARAKGFSNVVRAIEGHICLFSGWMREFHGPGFVKIHALQPLSRKVWVVILPTGSRNMSEPFKLGLAIYLGEQDAQPHTLIALWKANLEELKPNQPDPLVIILDNSTKRRIKLAPAKENDLQQFQWFCNFCKGIIQHQSKDELVYHQVSCGNIEGIKALRREGAGLEWIDEGKTPLILACMNPELYNVAKFLIEFGANFNAYHPGQHAGTPLHHAAKRGLQNTVKLLLLHGANPQVVNDDCQTPLDVARAQGFGNVVRAIEEHICLFSGWMWEFFGPRFLEVLASQLLSRKVWVVILPTVSCNMSKPFKLDLAIYAGWQDARPRTVIALWKANLEEPTPNQPDPSVIIVDNSTKTRIKLAPVKENDLQQLQWFCDACKGITQAMRPAFLQSSQPPASQATAPPVPDAGDLQLSMELNASIQSAISEMPAFDLQSSSETSASTSRNSSQNTGSYNRPGALVSLIPPKASSSDWMATEAGSSSSATQGTWIQNSNTPAVPVINQSSDFIPSAPPIANEIIEDGHPIHYPSIDTSPIDLSTLTDITGPKNEDGNPSSCAVCLDAPSEAACVPCGHFAGCVSCLNEIKAKKWGCPVCRAQIEQVIKIYRV